MNETRTLAITLLFCLIFLIEGKAQKIYSGLWGINGAKWERSKVPDFTKAGYKAGTVALPRYKVSINIKEMGAAGNGIQDDTEAFRKAIQICGEKGTVYLPEGRYLIRDTILIKKNALCIRGAGQNKTMLLIDKGLEQLYPKYGLKNSKQSSWSWSGAMILFEGDIADSGIEDLSIQFPDTPWSNHDFHENAYNAIGFSDHAHDGWVRNVTITGSDVGIWIESSAHHITAENWLLNFGPIRNKQEIQGHHGLNIYGGYNLLQQFEIRGKFWHDLSVESVNSTYNVFRNGKGTDLCIDHHNHAQKHNLFTNLDAGIGSRLYFSGGNEAPLGICFQEIFWNIKAKNLMAYCNEKNDSRGRALNNVCVGIYTNLPSEFLNRDGNWFESIDPTKLYPQDLYKAQMSLIHKR